MRHSKLIINLLDVNLITCSFFQWQDILQIVIPRSSALAAAAAGGGDNFSNEEGHTTCPICLSPPTAPRMTKCGHVSILIRRCQSQVLTFIIICRSSVFRAYYIIWVHQKIPSGLVVRSVSTRSTRNSSRVFTGLLHLPTWTMVSMVPVLSHRLHRSLLMTIRRRPPGPDQLCECGSCSVPR